MINSGIEFESTLLVRQRVALRGGRRWHRLLVALSAVSLSYFWDTPASAQVRPPGPGGGGGVAGIKIDADGLVTLAFEEDHAGKLNAARASAFAEAQLPANVNQPTPRRFLSLRRWEQALATALADNAEVPHDVFYTAGLQRIDALFIDPDEGDIILCGPAAGFAPDRNGRMVGIDSGRPVLRLDDWLIAVRTLRNRGPVGCSIDPVPERLADLQQFIKQNTGAATLGVAEQRFKKMKDVLGLQNVTVLGVAPDSHFAAALVEADHRMKRISMKLEKTAVKGLKSHLDLLKADGNSMQRWWFVVGFDELLRSRDGLSFSWSGDRVQLLAQEELASAEGQRSNAATTRHTTQQFAKQFNQKFAELAATSPVFGELQNLVDWTLVAAIVQREGWPQRLHWPMSTFLDEKAAPHAATNVPRKIPSSMNYRKGGSGLVGLVGGGVRISARDMLGQVTVADDPAIDRVRTLALAGLQLDVSESASQPADVRRWWWDSEAAATGAGK